MKRDYSNIIFIILCIVCAALVITAVVTTIMKKKNAPSYEDDIYVNQTPEEELVEEDSEESVSEGLSFVRWVAVGDSITEGNYSLEDGTYSKTNTMGWVVHVAELTGMMLDNRGIGGTGFVDTKDKYDETCGRTVVDGIDFSNYDLATIAYGTNDWRNCRTLGTFDDDIETGGTIYSNMRYMVEKILKDNPKCKIVVITPLNFWEYGSYETDWALGHKMEGTGITLADIFNAEKEVCEYYNLEMIDMTYNSFLNRDNVQEYMLDKLHPTPECYKLLGEELTDKIKDLF